MYELIRHLIDPPGFNIATAIDAVILAALLVGLIDLIRHGRSSMTWPILLATLTLLRWLGQVLTSMFVELTRPEGGGHWDEE